MIDWLLNILYNVGMFIGALIAIICVFFYFSAEAEYKNTNISNYRMLQEMRKLNRLQKEQIELEKTAQIQTEMRALNITQAELDSLKPPGFFERMNMKMDAWNQRMDEQAAQKKQARSEKTAPLQQANVQYLKQKLEEEAKEQTRLYDLQRRWDFVQLEVQVTELKRLMEEENTPASTAYTVMENIFNAEFWENYAAIKAEYMALNDVDMVAQINAEQASYQALKQELEAVLFPELIATQTPRSTPPPLPVMS